LEEIKLGIVTPAKNEEESLPKVYNSIINQSLKPKVWIIVDDGSTDKTSELIEKFKQEHSFIKSIKLGKGKWDLGIHYSEVCISGFDQLLNDYPNLNYIALIDADIILEKDYLRKITSNMGKNPKLGISGGGVYVKNKKGDMELEKTYLDHVRGANRIWKIECFKNTGGFMKTFAPDSVSNAKAKINGWKVRQYPKVVSYQTRPTSAGFGLWKGFLNRGKVSYFLNYHPLHVFLRFLKYLIKFPFYHSFAYPIGYLKSVLKNDPKIKDKAIKKYFHNKLFFRLKNK
jgi:glycosyltransferase involved in cell wall biosynthesis